MVIFRVVAKRLCLAAVMFAFVTAISACGVVKLKSIPEELIPDDLKADIEAMATKGRPITDIKWRVYEVVDGRVLAACTFKQEFEPGVKLDVFWLQSYEVDEDGSRVLETDCGGGGGFDTSRDFTGMAGSGGRSLETGGIVHNLHALGYCLDARVQVIKGATSEGKTVETRPAGGFWALYIDNVGSSEKWISITGLDKKGRVVVELPLKR
jgi:hypothetical protein